MAEPQPAPGMPEDWLRRAMDLAEYTLTEPYLEAESLWREAWTVGHAAAAAPGEWIEVPELAQWEIVGTSRGKPASIACGSPPDGIAAVERIVQEHQHRGWKNLEIRRSARYVRTVLEPRSEQRAGPYEAVERPGGGQ